MQRLFITLICLIPSLSFAKTADFKVIDQGGSGPFSAIAATETSLSDYVIYRPKQLSAGQNPSTKLPVMVFANGGCMDTSFPFEHMLSDIASHGYLVIALGKMQNSLDDRPLNKASNSMIPHAIDWITAQSSNPLSEFYQSANLEKIAIAGQSCGGAQLLATAADKRVSSYLMFNSGIGDMTMANADVKSLQNLHAPVIYLVGGPTDIATDNAKLDYQRINHVPVIFANHKTAGHSGTFEQPFGGSFSKLAIKWLDWQLKDKQSNSGLFLQGQTADFVSWDIKAKQF
ncbi:alpha/beta hydrolase [uncultured Pseudoalteromonas sp.]|uniref:poly(ethylene terephthalate) hydrolase family protein n=1 Tax=uncultured Pseudoalteromonas sp. TaxID=114053 RepID=UPI0030D9FFC3|tara:strand:+ start:46524 stop:47384 length:861 start_codon:yes stop_codon:yes gene_type:complete